MKEREVAVSDQEQIGCIRFLFWGQILKKKNGIMGNSTLFHEQNQPTNDAMEDKALFN